MRWDFCVPKYKRHVSAQLIIILLGSIDNNNSENYLFITTSSNELATEAGERGKAMSSAHVM